MRTKRPFTAPEDGERCTATASNFPGRKEVARCMRRRAPDSELCAQHKVIAAQKFELYLNAASDYGIRDGSGRAYTPAEARAAYENGRLSNWNLAFQRLIENDFDLAKVRAHYADGGR